MYTITLKKIEEKRILNGFPWVYANEVYKIEGKDKQGSVARVQAFDGRFVGIGFINHLSKILVRILSLKDEIVDEDFFRRRIRNANIGASQDIPTIIARYFRNPIIYRG